MSGHSKWANIKRRKGAVDVKRAVVFTKLIREISVAAKVGGGNPDGNPRLRLAIDKARAQSVPRDKIDNAVKKGLGELGGDTLEEVTYEGYGPGGAAILIEGTTDNKTRTVAEIRMIFSKNGGNFGDTGSVAWMFRKRGVLYIPIANLEEEALFEMALEAGADDIQNEDDEFKVITNYEDFAKVAEKLSERGVTCREAGIEMIPKNTVPVDNEEQAKELLTLVSALEDNDDVQHVWTNFDIDEQILEKAAS